MSTKSETRDESFPWITPEEMPKWDILLKAYLSTKKVHDALSTPKPAVDQQKLAGLLRNGAETRESKAYEKEMKGIIKTWDDNDGMAYGIVVRACTLTPSALSTVLENPGVSAAGLYAALKDRFNQTDMVGVVQAKLAAFNSMVLADSETAEQFINRLIIARIGLNNLNCDYIDKDVHCLGRLKEGLQQDERFRTLALNLSCATDMTWDRAVKIVTAYEMSNATRLADGGQKDPLGVSGTGVDTVRRLKQHFNKKIQTLTDKFEKSGYKNGKACTFCHKPGHTESECRSKQKRTRRDSKGSRGDRGAKDPDTRKCFHCGQRGHLIATCRKRKSEDDAGGSSRGKSTRYVDDAFSDGERSRMLSEYTRKHAGKITLDSGATSHMLGRSTVSAHRDTDLHEVNKVVDTAKVGESMVATKRGRVGNLQNVLVMEDSDLSEGIASVATLDLEGKFVLFGGSAARIYDSQMNFLAQAPLGGDKAYRFELSDLTGEERARLGSAMPSETLELYHTRLGHKNKRDLGHAIKEGLVVGAPMAASVHRKTGLCDACVKAKSTRHSFSKAVAAKSPKRATALVPQEPVVRRVVTDLKGPISVPGTRGENYLQLFTEADTRFRVCKTMTTKAQAVVNLREYIEVDLASEGQRLLEYHSDAAPELISKETVTYLASKGCRVSYSPPYTPERNGMAERSNRTIWESAYAMWLACMLPASFWPYAVVYATVIANMLPTDTALGWMAPFQAKYGAPPDIHMFRIFGCIAFAHVPEALRDSTFADKAYKGYFVGLKWPLLDRFLVYIPSLDKVSESAHVLFDEITKVNRKEEELLIVNAERKTVKDFSFLTHMAYKDEDNGILFVTTRVTTSRGLLVAYRAPLMDGRLGQEEPKPIHAQDVENMLTEYLKHNEPRIWSNNRLTSVRNVLQGAPMGRVVPRADPPLGIQGPAAIAAPLLSGGNPGTVSAENSINLTEQSGTKPQLRACDDPCEHTAVNRTSPAGQTRADLEPTAERTRPQRARIPRQPLNVSTFGDVSERAAYLAVQDLTDADESNEKAAEWVPAKVEEMRSLVLEHDAWDVVDLPPQRKTISTKWVVKRKDKPVPKLKARFTPRGFSQKAGVDYGETFAPVAKLVTLRIFLTIVAIMSLSTCQLDLKTAFLNATLEEEIYCQPVHDHVGILERLGNLVKEAWQRSRVAQQLSALQRGAVLRMKKACYGLKQAPREWWKKLHAFLSQLGFKANQSDICFYVLHLAGGALVLLLLYVDDILLAATTVELLRRYSSLISKAFRVSSEGPLTSYLGFDLEIDLRAYRIYLLMDRFMEKAFKRFKLVPKQSVRTPLPENFQAALEEAEEADDQFVQDFQYREKIGCILYYMICMRPDIAYAVGLLARYSNKVSRSACAGVTQLLQYCHNTRSQRLVLGGRRAYITAYCDSDWAGDRETRKSTGAYIVYLGTGPVEWASKLQRLPAQSSAEAEFIALNAPAKSIVWMRWLLKQTAIPQLVTTFSSTLFGDNTASLAMASNPVHHNRTKHIAIKYYLIRSLVEAGVIAVEHVDTLLNVADIGTKALGRVKFEPLCALAMGRRELERPTKRQKTDTSDEFA